MSTSVLSDRKFADFGELAESVRDSTGALNSFDFTQLEQGQPTIRSASLDLNLLSVSLFSTSHAVKCQNRTTPGAAALVLKQHAAGHASWNGVDLPEWPALLMPTGPDYETICESGFADIEISIPNALIDEEGFAVPDSAGLQTALSAPEGRRLAAELSAIHREAANAPPAKANDLQHRLFNICLWLITRLEAAGYPEPISKLAYGRVCRAQKLVDEALPGSIDLVTLAHRLETSTRTLRREFMHILGVPPKSYMLARRLEAAKRELQQPTCTTVADVSDKFGFSHPSRFAEQYKRHFGQLPSTRLRT